MNISKFINIPQKQKHHYPYLSLFKLLLSMLTGILLICFRIITIGIQHEHKDIFQVLYLFIFILIFKAFIPINFLCRKKTIKGIKKIQTIIPAILKSLLYAGSLVGTLFIRDLIVLVFIFVVIVMIEGLSRLMNKHVKWDCVSLLVEILMFLAFWLNLSNSTQNIQISTYFMVMVVGSICLLSYYYLHYKAFRIYQEDVDGMLAKQYLIQAINIIIIIGIYSVGAKTSFIYRFTFVVEFPVHLFICMSVSVFYEYLCYQMMKKLQIKSLFSVQLTGLFWFNLFCLKEMIVTRLVLSTLVSFLGFIVCLEVVKVSHFSSLAKWIKNLCFSEEKELIQEQN